MNEHSQWCIESHCANPTWVTDGKNGRRVNRYKYCRTCAIRRNTARNPAKGPVRREDKEGYVWVRTADGLLRHEHKVVMEAKLGRPLLPGESVHHKNGIRSDNKRSNLELWVGSIRYGQRARDIVCPHCGGSYATVPEKRAPQSP